MTARVLALLAAAVVATVAVCAGLTTVLFFGGAPALGCGTAPTATSAPVPSVTASATLAAVGRWDAVQTGYASTIIAVGARHHVPPRGWVIALATAMQESGLRNLGDLGAANDHDSLGLFLQRPSQGWGTAAQVMDPVYAATRFYDKLLQVPQWQELPLTVAAQKIQVSAYPGAYAKWEPDAQQLVSAVASQGSWTILDGLEQCVSTAGWTHPLPGYKVSSDFRTESRPTHDGVDIAAPPGTPIRAAAAGVVIRVLCNASLNGQPYSCDVSGSPAVKGCGHYLEVRTGDYIHRYCHLLRQPLVKAGQVVEVGQVIGVVGTSGNSSGPHLHYEVHRGLNASSSTAISPVLHMRAMGVQGF